MLKKSLCVRQNADMVDVEAPDGRTVAVSHAETGKGYTEDGWDRDGVNDDAVANPR